VWPQWVSQLADDKLFQSVAGIAAILALVITCRVWWITSRISERISANARLPALRRQLANDLTELNRLNLASAPVHEIATRLATCRSRLRSIRHYRSDIRPRRLVRAKISIARFAALFGADGVVRPLSYSVYGELREVVADIDEFTASIPLRGTDA
jgi:ABC-type transport system involved in cytochrome bd biosynthesis fused ATPase/permease subunit